MRYRLVAAGAIAVLLSACNTQNALTEHQLQVRNFTMADVIPPSHTSSQAEKDQQQTFRKDSKKRFSSGKIAAAYYVAEAKRNFNEQKPDSAAQLFGQAWLLDSTNNEVYWGYGLVYGQQKEFDKALFVLYRALEEDKENPRLLTDIATSHLGRFYETNQPEDLLQSRKLLEKAVSYTPDFADAYYKLAINSYYLQEYGKAWEYLHKSILQNNEIANPTFVAALLQKQADPQGVYQQ
ncbi:tetratricopeptide repeat protein [Pontibacter sp. 13R65]|uniref:tetratricopeptide repeat protein n=1 Tax=Pontibacter sp. 13R65 TaxID=3127458 RepID=UPI00301CBE5D